MQGDKEISQLSLQTDSRWTLDFIEASTTAAQLRLFAGAVFELLEHVLELWGQLTQHLDNFLRFIVMRQTGKRLEKDREAVKFVPQRQYHANLLYVVARWIPFEKVRIAALLFLDVKLCVFKHRVGYQGLHEFLRVDLQQDLRGHFKHRKYTLVQFPVVGQLVHFLLAGSDLQLSQLLRHQT